MIHWIIYYKKKQQRSFCFVLASTTWLLFCSDDNNIVYVLFWHQQHEYCFDLTQEWTKKRLFAGTLPDRNRAKIYSFIHFFIWYSVSKRIEWQKVLVLVHYSSTCKRSLQKKQVNTHLPVYSKGTLSVNHTHLQQKKSLISLLDSIKK